ncbi:MAG: aldolase, partial [Actinomycetota bacterium]
MGRLTPAATRSLLAGVAEADAAHRRDWPGRPTTRQPVQVLYVPAHRLPEDPVATLGGEARRLLADHAPDGVALASAVDLPGAMGDRVHARVRAKLDREPIEDLRVDFEDGYVGHDEAEEDADAVRTGRIVGRMLVEDRCTPFVGLRVKSFTDGLAGRSVATLDAFLEALLGEAGRLPDGFVVTFPKIVAVAHVAAFVDVLAALEDAHGLAPDTLGFEAQIETTASVLGPDGRVVLRDIRDAGAGRLRAVHFGVFDYTAALGVPPEQQ